MISASVDLPTDSAPTSATRRVKYQRSCSGMNFQKRTGSSRIIVAETGTTRRSRSTHTCRAPSRAASASP